MTDFHCFCVELMRFKKKYCEVDECGDFLMEFTAFDCIDIFRLVNSFVMVCDLKESEILL